MQYFISHLYSIKDFYQNSIQKLKDIYGVNEAQSIVNIWFTDKYNINKIELKSDIEFLFKDIYHEDLERLLNSEPVQYLCGFTYFLNHKFVVNNSVLIPRPETEELVLKLKEICLKNNFKKIVEIGTGSGCISIGIANLLHNITVLGTDISTSALEIANLNKLNLLKNNNLKFIKHDILNQNWELEIPEIVVSNPPYIELKEKKNMNANILQHEPHLALFVTNNDSLQFYKSIINKFYKIGVKHFLFEINQYQKENLSQYFESIYANYKFHKDLNQNDRLVYVWF